MKCKDCKWSFGKDPMWCGRHAPIVIANPRYSKDQDEVYLTLQPEVKGDLYCGDFEAKDEKSIEERARKFFEAKE